MNSKRKTLVLRQGEEIGTGKVKYVVAETFNTVEWAVGQTLDKKEVEEIIERRNHPIEVKVKGGDR